MGDDKLNELFDEFQMTVGKQQAADHKKIHSITQMASKLHGKYNSRVVALQSMMLETSNPGDRRFAMLAVIDSVCQNFESYRSTFEVPVRPVLIKIFSGDVPFRTRLRKFLTIWTTRKVFSQEFLRDQDRYYTNVEEEASRLAAVQTEISDHPSKRQRVLDSGNGNNLVGGKDMVVNMNSLANSLLGLPNFLNTETDSNNNNINNNNNMNMMNIPLPPPLQVLTNANIPTPNPEPYIDLQAIDIAFGMKSGFNTNVTSHTETMHEFRRRVENSRLLQDDEVFDLSWSWQQKYRKSSIDKLTTTFESTCTQCGLRLKSRSRLAPHLDLHYQLNSKRAEAKTTLPARDWFVSATDWIQGGEILRSKKSLDDDQKQLEQQQSEIESIPTVPVENDNDSCKCFMCLDGFKTEIDDDMDDWVIKGALYFQGAQLVNDLELKASQLNLAFDRDAALKDLRVDVNGKDGQLIHYKCYRLLRGDDAYSE